MYKSLLSRISVLALAASLLLSPIARADEHRDQLIAQNHALLLASMMHAKLKADCEAMKDEKSCVELSEKRACHWKAEKCEVHNERVNASFKTANECLMASVSGVIAVLSGFIAVRERDRGLGLASAGFGLGSAYFYSLAKEAKAKYDALAPKKMSPSTKDGSGALE